MLATRMIWALGMIIGLSSRRLCLDGLDILILDGALWRIGRGGRKGLHGRVSLGGGRRFLRGMEIGGTTRDGASARSRARAGARELGLVMRPHGVLDAGMGIVDVLHGDVAGDVSTLGDGGDD